MKYYQKHAALGSIIELCIVTDLSQTDVDTLYNTLWQRIFSFEKQCSRFLPASEVSFLNRRAGTKHTITPSFRQVLIATKLVAEQSEGLFNPFILPALQAAGYVHSLMRGHENDPTDDYSHRSVPPIQELEIGDTWARIPYNSALDLGGCGKGYIADQLVALLPNGVTGYWLSMGGDMVVGGCDENHTPWRIGVQDARSPENDCASITIPIGSRCAVATSSIMQRRGVKQGTAWHHILDPRTLTSAKTSLLSVTTCCTTAIEADVFASCAIIADKDGMPFLKRHGVTAAFLQSTRAKKQFGTLFAVDEYQKGTV